MTDYDPTDFALLFELRLALEEEKLVPMPLLRVLQSRGWVQLPARSERLEIDAEADDELFPIASYTVGQIHLTRAGEREVALFAQGMCYEEMRESLTEEEIWLDDSGIDGEDDL